MNGPVVWILNEGKSIPRDAILGGEENGESIYICRVYYQVRTYRLVVDSAADIQTVTRAESVSLQFGD